MPLLPVREIPETLEISLVCTITGTPLPDIEVIVKVQSLIEDIFSGLKAKTSRFPMHTLG
jgi:hypothetical protein